MDNFPPGLFKSLWGHHVKQTNNCVAKLSEVTSQQDALATKVSEAAVTAERAAVTAERAVEKAERALAAMEAPVQQLNALVTRERESQDQNNQIAETYALLVRQELPTQQRNADTLAENTAALQGLHQDVHAIKSALSGRDVVSETRDSIEQAFWAELTAHTSKERELLGSHISELMASQAKAFQAQLDSQAKAFQQRLAEHTNVLRASLTSAQDTIQGKPPIPLPVYGQPFGARMNAILGSAIIRIQLVALDVLPLTMLLLCAIGAVIAYRLGR